MMKRLILSLAFLVSVCTSAFAGTISISPFISGNDVTIAHLESMRTTISNAINGNIEGGINIKAGSLVSTDFSNSVSPITRWDEAFTDFTVTGMLPSTSANLTATTSTGTSYVDGFRVVIGSTANAYTASKDTYVFVHSGGYYVYSEVANGATQPSTPANTLLLAKVVTSGSAVTSVTDLRVTGISLSSTSSIVPVNYRDNLIVSQASSTTMTVGVGSVEVNSTKIAKTTATTLTISTAGDWAGGASLRAVSTYGYVGVDVSGNIKMHTTAPSHSDYALTNTSGVKRYVSWSSTTYRVIGWFYMNATGSGELNSFEVGNILDIGAYNQCLLNATAQSIINDTSYGSDLSNATMRFYSTGRPVEISFGCNADDMANGLSIIVDIDTTDKEPSERSSQATGSSHGSLQTYYSEVLSQGTHTITIQAKVDSGQDTVDGQSMTVKEL